MAASKPYTEHLFERLREPDEAGGYLAACLEESRDALAFPAEVVALCLQNIVQAWNLPIEITVSEAKAKS